MLYPKVIEEKESIEQRILNKMKVLKINILENIKFFINNKGRMPQILMIKLHI